MKELPGGYGDGSDCDFMQWKGCAIEFQRGNGTYNASEEDEGVFGAAFGDGFGWGHETGMGCGDGWGHDIGNGLIFCEHDYTRI